MAAEEAGSAVALMDSDVLCLEDFFRFVYGAGEEEKASELETAFRVYAPEGGACATPKSLRRMLLSVLLGERRSVDAYRNMIACFDLNGNLDEFKFKVNR